MPGTKLLALALAAALTGCGATSAQNDKPEQPGTSGSLGTLTPTQRMPVIRAKNDLVVAHSAMLNARDEHRAQRRRLIKLSKGKSAAPLLALAERRVVYLHAVWQHARAVEDEKRAALAYAEAVLAKKHRLGGYGSVAVRKRELELAKRTSKHLERALDMVLVGQQIPDVWEVSVATSHGSQSRLVAAVEFFEAMADVVVKSKKNCRLMATGLSNLFGRRSPMVSRIGDAVVDAKKKAIDPRFVAYRARADKATRTIRDGVLVCARDDKVAPLLRRLQ